MKHNHNRNMSLTRINCRQVLSWIMAKERSTNPLVINIRKEIKQRLIKRIRGNKPYDRVDLQISFPNIKI